MESHYDYIILGAGAAGLSLAYYIAGYSALADKKVLIIDKDDKDQNDRTWTFWGNPPDAFQPLIKKSWYKLGIYNSRQSVETSLTNVPYHYIPGNAFYQFTFQALKDKPQFHFLKAHVEDVQAFDDHPVVVADGRPFTADYVFNSAYPGVTNINDIQEHIAYQRFKGWEVQFEKPVINPDKITLMDFSAGPDADMQFAYLLPLASDRLIINYTAFGQQMLPPEFYEERMKTYLEDQISTQPYQILRREGGLIPMSHLPFKRYFGKKVINLGILGGDTRASTGYTFIHAVTNAQQMAARLAKGASPLAVEHKPRHIFYDRVFLHVLAAEPQALKKGLVQLFKQNPASLVFRFLGGETKLIEELPLIFSLPILPFIKGLMQMLIKNQSLYAGNHRLSKAGY